MIQGNGVHRVDRLEQEYTPPHLHFDADVSKLRKSTDGMMIQGSPKQGSHAHHHSHHGHEHTHTADHGASVSGHEQRRFNRFCFLFFMSLYPYGASAVIRLWSKGVYHGLSGTAFYIVLVFFTLSYYALLFRDSRKLRHSVHSHHQNMRYRSVLVLLILLPSLLVRILLPYEVSLWLVLLPMGVSVAIWGDALWKNLANIVLFCLPIVLILTQEKRITHSLSHHGGK